jgi:hypothetical protein
MAARPRPITAPKVAFRINCVRKSLPRRLPTASSAAVVRSRSSLPANRRKRFRRSTLEKTKYQKNDNEAGRREWRHQRPQHCHQGLRCRRVGIHRNGCFTVRTVRKRRSPGWNLVLVLRIQFPIEIFQQVRAICERSGAAGGVAEIAYLFTQGGLITGEGRWPVGSPRP